MSRHKTKLKGEKLCPDKDILCRDIPFEYSNCKALNKCNDIRHSCRDNYKTTSAELFRDIFKVGHDIIQEEGMKLCRDRKLQATTKLENKDDNYVAT